MELTIALGDYAHTRTLQSGVTLRHDGHAVNVLRMTDTPAAIFRRAREVLYQKTNPERYSTMEVAG